MPSRFIVFAAASLLLAVTVPLATLAEDAAKPTPAQIADGQSKARVAYALIILGRSAKDNSDGKPVCYDVNAIVAEADSYAANSVRKTVASFDCETQNPSGPRQPGPPLQPQPLQRQVSSANAIEGPCNGRKEISKNAPAMRARMLHLPL